MRTTVTIIDLNNEPLTVSDIDTLISRCELASWDATHEHPSPHIQAYSNHLLNKLYTLTVKDQSAMIGSLFNPKQFKINYWFADNQKLNRTSRKAIRILILKGRAAGQLKSTDKQGHEVMGRWERTI